MSSKIPKQLVISASPIPGETSTELELVYGGRDIGALTLHADDFADFVEALRAGFTVIAEQRTRDVAMFVQAADDEDDDPEDD